jgi:hypothetical protein
MSAKQSQEKSIERAKLIKTPVSNWKQAVYQAEEEVIGAQEKIERLKKAIAVFKRMDADGIPWPGGSATQN